MYRCIANLEIDLDGLGEFYSELDEYEMLSMYQIISAWLQDEMGLIQKIQYSVYQSMP